VPAECTAVVPTHDGNPAGTMVTSAEFLNHGATVAKAQPVAVGTSAQTQ